MKLSKEDRLVLIMCAVLKRGKTSHSNINRQNSEAILAARSNGTICVSTGEIEEETSLARNPDDVGEIVDEEKINIPSRALVSQSLDAQEVDSARSAAIGGKGEDYFLLTPREKAQAQADLTEYRNERKRFWIVAPGFFSPIARLTA